MLPKPFQFAGDLEYGSGVGKYPIPIEWPANQLNLRLREIVGVHPAVLKMIVENTSFPDDPWVAEAAEVVFLIALRAPARHDEVENIRINDILYEDPVTGEIAELFLRPWRPRRMKSDASVRRTDLNAQFKPDEREVVEAWVRKRAANEGDLDANRRIFHWQGTSRGASSWAKVMSVVFAAMREVTKDSGFRLHRDFKMEALPCSKTKRPRRRGSSASMRSGMDGARTATSESALSRNCRIAETRRRPYMS